MKNKTKQIEDKKNIKAKKLPGIFKRSYSVKKFEKKILKHIYIPSDKEMIQAIFTSGNNEKKPELLSVNKELLFTKQEIKKYKKLAVDIKSHKGRINGFAFSVLLICTAAVVAAVLLFKDVAVKKTIQNTCQTIFNAKTEVGYVKLNLMNSSLTVRNVKVGDSKNEYKNLFELGNVVLDFDVNELLKGRFVADQLSCGDMKFNTDRKTSCKLPEKKKKEKPVKQKKEQTEAADKKKVEKNSNEAFDFNKVLESKKASTVSLIQSNLTSALGGEDSDSIKDSILKNLSSPAFVENSKTEAEQIIAKWSAKPEEVKTEVLDFYNSAMALTKIDLTKVPDVQTLTKDIELITDAIKKGNVVKNDVQVVYDNIKNDSEHLIELSEQAKNSINADSEYIKSILDSVKGIENSGKAAFENAVNSVYYQYIGKYYPYVKKGMEYVKALKSDGGKKASKKIKKNSQTKRLKGTNFYYSAANPEFLIKKAFVSGESFSCDIREITNNQNVRNKTSSVDLKLNLSGISHSVQAIIDTRKDSNNSLISFNYSGKGFKLNFDGSQVAVKSGVPSLDGNADIEMSCIVAEDDFLSTGTVDLKTLKLTSDGFNNDLITKYYNLALSEVKTINMYYELSINSLNGINLLYEGNVTNQFVKALSNTAKQIGMDAKKEAYKKLNEYLNVSGSDVEAAVGQVTRILTDVDSQRKIVEQIQTELQKKITDIQKELENKATEAATKAAEQAKKAATDAASQAVDEAKKQAENAAKNLLKGFTR